MLRQGATRTTFHATATTTTTVQEKKKKKEDLVRGGGINVGQLPSSCRKLPYFCAPTCNINNYAASAQPPRPFGSSQYSLSATVTSISLIRPKIVTSIRLLPFYSGTECISIALTGHCVMEVKSRVTPSRRVIHIPCRILRKLKLPGIAPPFAVMMLKFPRTPRLICVL